MAKRLEALKKLEQLKCESGDEQRPSASHDGDGHRPGHQCSDPLHGEGAGLLAASASSPSLLTGCSDPTTPTGANIEKHIQAHHVFASPQVDTSGPSSFPTSPLTSPISGDPPDSMFLTPAQPRSIRSDRPTSAPPHHLERISGTLLRLVGDHYMCSTCGRELRTIGDQLTLETNLRHAFSAVDLNRLQNG